MGITDRLKEEARKRLLKREMEDKLSGLVSDERAEKITNTLLGDEEENSEVNNESGREKEDEESSSEDVEEASWLDKKAEEAEEYMEEDSGPVTSLDDMDELIEEKKRKSGQTDEDERE